MLINIGRTGLNFDSIVEIEINLVIVSGTKPVVVDALMVFGGYANVQYFKG